MKHVEYLTKAEFLERFGHLLSDEELKPLNLNPEDLDPYRIHFIPKTELELRLKKYPRVPAECYDSPHTLENEDLQSKST
jgi:hypothetical protein